MAGFRLWLLSVMLAAGVVAAPSSFAEDASSAAAFGSFVKAGNYENADFYLKNNYVAPADIDTSRLFYEALTGRYLENLAANAAAIEKLYRYLAAIGPIDLNRAMPCGDKGAYTCLLVNDLVTVGARRDAFAYFHQKGLDLNRRVPAVVPATVPLLVRLGSVYSMDDVNYLSSLGMVLGDEAYTLAELSEYRDGRIGYNYEQLRMPGGYATAADQNLLDVMVITLGTDLRLNAPAESDRRRVLCSFISYAAASFVPSFDYLDYLIASVEEFRPGNVRPQADGSRMYQPFPDSCAALVVTMAANHVRITDIVNSYATRGDVETARWLQAIGQPRQN